MQKSKVQEMFPIDKKGLWWSTFITCSLISAIGVLFLIIWLFSDQVLTFMAGDYTSRDVLHVLGVLSLGSAGLLIILYFLTRYVVGYYNLDIIDQAIVERFVSFNHLFWRSYYSAYGLHFVHVIPLSMVHGVSVKSRTFGGSYCLSIYAYNSVVSLGSTHIGYFDEKTAFAFKEYILSQAKNAKDLEG